MTKSRKQLLEFQRTIKQERTKTMTNQTCTWIGASGIQYTYYVFPLPYDFSPNQNGNYIYAKLINQEWYPVYIGEGDLKERVSPNHHQAQCITDKGATHIHAHLNPFQASRTSEESDLLSRYLNTYAPYGCNIKIGG